MSRRAARHSEATRILPAEAVAPRRQLELVDVSARLGPAADGVPIGAVSRALGIAERTIADAHGFLRQNGLFEAGCQTFTLTPAGRRLAELRALDSAHARLYLRELWASAWFTTAAVGLLRPCPHDTTALAEHLIRGVSRRIERGLHLVHWLEYALVVRKGDDGRMTLVRETLTPPPSLSFMVTSEAVTALPRERFLEVMDAYRTITRALSPSPQPAETSPRDQQHA